MATFGKTTDGTATTTSTIDRKKVSSASPSSSGTVTSITIRGAMDTTSTVIKGVIYADSAGAPSALLAVSDEIIVNSATIQDWTGAFSGVNQINITSGTTYWIGWLQKSPGFDIRRDGNSGASLTGADTYSDGPTDPFGATTAEAGPVAVYVTYTEGGGGGGGGTVPVIRSSSTDTDPTTTKTLAPAKPTGLAVGDLMIAVHTSDADSDLAVMTAPAGWTQLGAQAGSAADNYSYLKIWSKVAVQADVDATTFSFSDPNTTESSVVLFAVQVGTYDSTTPTSIPSFTTQPRPAPEAVQDATAPSVTGVVDGLLICGMTADTNGTQQTFPSPPTGMTVINQASTPWTLDGVFKQALSSTSATGTRSAGTSPTSGANGYNSGSFVVNPAPAPAAGNKGAGFLALLLS